MKNRKVYISGQISGLNLDDAMTNFKIAEIELYADNVVIKRQYITVINPFDIKPLFGVKKWLFYMIRDVYQLLKCEEIYMLRNWQNSKGARIELAVASLIGLKVTFQK